MRYPSLSLRGTKEPAGGNEIRSERNGGVETDEWTTFHYSGHNVELSIAVSIYVAGDGDH